MWRLNNGKENQTAYLCFLLLTTGCVEYWFLLHYKKLCPSIQNVAEKGNPTATRKIAERLDKAIQNGDWVLQHIEGLPTLEDNDARNRWLYQSTLTFTTVQDAMKFLESLGTC